MASSRLTAAWTTTACVVLGGCSPPSPLPAPEPGVPIELARARAAALTDLSYDLTLRIPAERDVPVAGSVVARFTLNEPAEQLAFDFEGDGAAVQAAVVDGGPVTPRVENGHILFTGLGGGSREVRIDFTASDTPLNRNDEFLYSLFVPARAHEVFPSFDQPDLKARVALTLEIPADWTAVSNGAELDRRVEDGRLVIRFAETKPLPTYLLAFAAGRFQVVTDDRDGRTFRMFHRETDAGKVARSRDTVFDLHASTLAWLEEYTGIPYPWGKFDFVLVPGFQFGGMEHAGAIFYRADSLLLEPSPTQNQLLGRASLIAHETAHMWFGDLVTMRWFDDVWMKEVFANFMAAKIVNPSFPDIDHDLRFFLSHYRAAHSVDRTNGTHPIRQRLDNLSDAGTMYGPIIYQKAPLVMRQLERLTGEDRFRDGLRHYLTRHAFGNATWPDLVAVLDERSDVDLAAWSNVWVEQSGRPVVETVTSSADGRVERLVVTQRDPSGLDRLWPQAVELEIGDVDGVRRVPVTLGDAEVAVPSGVGLPEPDYMVATGGGLVYGDVVFSASTREWLLENLPRLPEALSRGAVWGALWEEMLQARTSPKTLADLALRALAREPDELNVERLLGDLERLYWLFLPIEARERVTPRVEQTLRRGLGTARSQTLRSAWFRSLTRVARSSELVSWLADVWRGDVQIAGLELAETDMTDLALELALRLDIEGPGILDTQHERIDNPDRQMRFAFIRPALSPDPEARARFFDELAQPERRRREAWVISSLRYLHHPLRASESVRLVLPSLELLEEVQATGDIFFPDRWTGATLSGHRSREVADIVESFLAARPDYPLPLRRIILQNVDDLLRVAAWENP